MLLHRSHGTTPRTDRSTHTVAPRAHTGESAGGRRWRRAGDQRKRRSSGKQRAASEHDAECRPGIHSQMKKKGAASSSLFILWEKASKAKKTDAKLYCNIINSSPKSQKLQALGVKLKTLWEFHNTPPKEIVKFAEVLICVDAVSASEMSGEKSLSLGAITKVTEEIAYLENRKAIKLKNKYLNKKNKLLKMIQENHQLPAEFNYDPQEKVTSDFPEEVAKLKPIMERVKVQALDRKEIVMRTEVVLESVKQPSCAKTTERLLRALKDRVANETGFLFDGKDIKVVLNEIQVETKPENSKLALEKRASSRLRDHQNTKEVTVELPDLPPTPYPSGVRSGHRSQRNLAWGNKPSK